MSEVPVELIVAAFQSETGADEALQELKAAKKAQWIDIANAAVLRRDSGGKLHIKETDDKGFGRGAGVGAVIGGALAILFPPSILAGAALGALAGGAAAKIHDGGFSDARLRELGESLLPGTSAIVAVIEHKWVLEAEAALREQGAKVMVESLKADIAEQLQAGRNLAVSAVATEEGLAVSRAAVGEGHIEVSEMSVTSEGLTGSSIVATDEGADFTAVAADDKGATIVTGKVTPLKDTPAELPAAETPATPAE